MKKILLSLSIIVAVAAIVVGGTMAYFSDTETSAGNTFTSGTMNLGLSKQADGSYGDSVGGTWNIGNMAPGGDPYVSTLYMKNTGSIDADYLKFVARNTTTKGIDKQVRITELKYAGNSLLTGGAGADLSNYVAPTHCDVTVDPINGTYKSIGAGIAAATTAGDVVCVKHGDYTQSWETSHSGLSGYPYTISKSITLVSLGGPDDVTLSPAGTDALKIQADNVTVKGFTIAGAAMGIYTEGHSGITIRDNRIVGYDVEGVKINGGDITITNNVIQAKNNSSTSADSIYTKGITTASVSHNDLGNNQWSGKMQSGASNPNAWSTAAGIAVHQGCNVTATYNKIYSNDFGIQVKGEEATDATSPTVTANYNDILDSNYIDFFYEKVAGEDTIPFDATNNWWGEDGVANVKAGDGNGFIDVDSYIKYTPYAGGPFIGYINGKDYNNNGFADLSDFYGVTDSNHDNNPLVVENPDLKVGGTYHTLVMGVQLDGPTTGNDFMNGTVNTNMTVTMGQGPAN